MQFVTESVTIKFAIIYIQQFRFGDKLELAIEYIHGDDIDDVDILMYRLSKLTLQPIVENSIYHGIEEKLGKGHLKIRITATKENLIIKISDDGMGIEGEKLKALNKKLQAMNLDDVNPNASAKGGIAIMNMNNRMKLLFGEKYGVYIYSQPGVGTDVEITLPEVMGISDRIIVMRDGRVAGELDIEEATQDRILKYATQFESKITDSEAAV